jgi:hypothetical protein
VKHVYLLIPADFSVGAVNALIKLAKQNDLGAILSVDYYGDWDWCLRCEKGCAWSYLKHTGESQ